MNLINPQLLLSAQVASLVLLASLFASVIVWLCCRRSSPQAQRTPGALAAGEGAGNNQSEELRRHLAATESQCVGALEQRDEADRQAVLRAGELRKVQEEHAQCLQKLAQAEALASLQQAQIDKLQEALQGLSDS